MKKHHLTLEERVLIKVYIQEGYNRSQVAKKLNRSKSCINRELKKWGIVGNLIEKIKDYDPHLAHWYKIDGKSVVKKGNNKIADNPKLLSKIKSKLKKRWSPQQISQWLKKNFPNDKKMQISHESIYNYIYNFAKGILKLELISYLRRSKRIRKSNKGKFKGGSKIKNRLSIDHRPKIVELRKEIGHWEGDLIIGKNRKNVIGTLVERVTRFTLIVKPKSRKAKDVRKAFENALKKVPHKFKKSLTYDNGLEMAEHKQFTKNTNMPVYFCHPYASWERGTNENTNGLIRDFWPKKSAFATLSYYDIKKVQDLLNGRPRKIVNWNSPADLLKLKKRKKVS